MEFIFLINRALLVALIFIFSSWYLLLLLSFLKKYKRRKLNTLPKVSVLIPAFNEEKNIGRCLMGLKKLDYPKEKLEVIVVDDGSEDNTSEIAKRYGAKVYKINHQGKAAALNFGLKKCRGEYVLVLDADTIIDRGFVKEALTYFYDDVAAVTAGSNVLNEKNILTLFQKVEYVFSTLFKKALSVLSSGFLFVYGAATLYKASILKKFGFKNTAVEDFDIALRLHMKGYKIIQINKFGYTVVPTNVKSLLLQRRRWYTHVLNIPRNYGINFFIHLNPSLSYTILLTYFWYINAALSIPSTIYLIYYWIPKYSVIEALLFIFKWFSFFGVIYNIYMLQYWSLSFDLIIAIIVGIMSYFFVFFSLAYYHELKFKNLIVSFFMYPYFFFIVNTSLLLSLYAFIKGEIA